ncbi:hypothetical protein [Nocardiopsis sp. CA-288880]|uniref:hypothetical protein n=1 Tax=Nocardiopsis sp. CA-288880 TaxID=3239995 RepID=UPI003D98D63A
MTALAQCPHCPKIVKTLKDGRIHFHGPKRTPCPGTRLDTTGWREISTPDGPLRLDMPKPA